MAMSHATAFQLHGDILEDYVVILAELIHHKKLQANNEYSHKVNYLAI